MKIAIHVPNYNYPSMRLHLVLYSAVLKYRSVRRAIRRNNLTQYGEEIPKRPFNNRKRTPGREMQINKEGIYGSIVSKWK